MIEHLTYWIEGNGAWHLMIKDGEIRKIEDNLYDLAIAQGCQPIQEETIALTETQMDELGLN